MDWITDDVAIGNYLEAQDVDLLRVHGINSIVSLNRTLQEKDAARLGLKAIASVPLEDGPGNDPRLFRLAVDAVEGLTNRAKPVLVHCHAGRSRSVVVVAGYLMRTQGLDADAALAFVAAKREIAVSPMVEALLDSLD
jgi:protein-tyrosine phosphatase